MHVSMRFSAPFVVACQSSTTSAFLYIKLWKHIGSAWPKSTQYGKTQHKVFTTTKSQLKELGQQDKPKLLLPTCKANANPNLGSLGRRTNDWQANQPLTSQCMWTGLTVWWQCACMQKKPLPWGKQNRTKSNLEFRDDDDNNSSTTTSSSFLYLKMCHVDQFAIWSKGGKSWECLRANKQILTPLGTWNGHLPRTLLIDRCFIPVAMALEALECISQTLWCMW